MLPQTITDHAAHCLWCMMDLDLHPIMQLDNVFLNGHSLVACLAACGLVAYVEQHEAAVKCCL